jgi:hypothetical protein
MVADNYYNVKHSEILGEDGKKMNQETKSNTI